MPYCKSADIPFARMRRLLKGYDLNGSKLANVLGCSATTGKRKLDNPWTLTLEDIDRINKVGHIPIEELREAISR